MRALDLSGRLLICSWFVVCSSTANEVELFSSSDTGEERFGALPDMNVQLHLLQNQHRPTQLHSSILCFCRILTNVCISALYVSLCEILIDLHNTDLVGQTTLCDSCFVGLFERVCVCVVFVVIVVAVFNTCINSVIFVCILKKKKNLYN